MPCQLRRLGCRALLALILIVGCDGGHATGPAIGDALRGRILYTRQPSDCGDCVHEIWSIGVDGSDPRYLAQALHWPGRLRVSPDGTRIVFEDASTLFIADADGQGLKPIPTGVKQQVQPDWSPDGEWVVFTGFDPVSLTDQIYRIRPDGTDREMLTDPARGSALYPAMSPHSDQLFFIRSGLMILDLASGDERLAVDTSGMALDGYCFEWSPDRSKIALIRYGGPISEFAVWTLDLHTRQYGFIADAHGSSCPAWSPDGSRILVGRGDLWTIPVDGTDPQLLLSDGFTNFAAGWGPP